MLLLTARSFSPTPTFPSPPVTGKVTEINPALDDDPMLVNRDPYGEAWMIKVELDDASETEQLLDATGYGNLISQ